MEPWPGQRFDYALSRIRPIGCRDPDTRDPVRVRVRVSSVTFCVQLEIYAAARRAAGGGGAAEPDTGTPWLAFYFILFALITSPATLLKNIFACWEISRSLFHAASLQSPRCLLLPLASSLAACSAGRVQGHGMAHSRSRRRLGKCIRFARAVNVKTMAQVFWLPASRKMPARKMRRKNCIKLVEQQQ